MKKLLVILSLIFASESVIADIEVIPQQFSDGYAAVAVADYGKNGPSIMKVGYIDKTGHWAIPPRFDLGEPFSDGVACVLVAGKWGFIDSKGQWIISPVLTSKPDGYSQFHEGLLSLKEEGEQWGFIDKTGTYVIPKKFARAGNFHEGLATVAFQDNGKWGYIDKEGNTVIGPQFSEAGDFSEGLAHFQLENSGKIGFIDKQGNVIIQPHFDWAMDFHEGLAAVELNGKWGFIDKLGRIVISPLFNDVDDFEDGIALARLSDGDDFGFINKQGKWAIKPFYSSDELPAFSNGVRLAAMSDKRPGYINKKGEWEISPDDLEFLNAKCYLSKELEQYATQGQVDSQASLGTCYLDGVGVQKNSAQALMWYAKAGEQGNIKSQRTLCILYQGGIGEIKKNDSLAVQWCSKASMQGDAAAQENLLSMADKGNAKALNSLIAIAKKGDMPSQMLVGNYYMMKKNMTEARKWWKLAAEQGNEMAKNLLNE